MLKNIPACLSPDLLAALCRLGHGDKILICDANCGGVERLGHSKTVKIRLDGVRGPELLNAILQVIPVDHYISDPIRLCRHMPGMADPPVWQKYEAVVAASEDKSKLKDGRPVYQDPDDFWSVFDKIDLAIFSGESDPYGNVFIQKGVVTRTE